LTLLNVGQNGRRNNLELVRDLGLTDLEIVYLLKHICAVAAALVHETVAGEKPVVLLHARVDDFVKGCQVVIEERLFTRVDQQEDIVVVADNKHHVFTEHTNLLPTAQKPGQWQREGDQSESLYLEPVLHFNQHFE
jgi:hypothetical protein